jgi:hypothetical protein
MDINDFISSSGRTSSTKTTEKYVGRHFPDEYILVKNNSKLIGLSDCTFSEELYHYFNNIRKPVVCKKCLLIRPKFQGLLRGYLEYCSSKCSNDSDDVKRTKEISSIKKYGVSNPAKDPAVMEKIRITFNKNYGGNPFTLDSFKERIKETNMEKYGTPYPLSSGSIVRTNIDDKLSIALGKKYDNLEVISIDREKNGSAILKCKVCNNDFEISKWNLHQRTKNIGGISPCTRCNPIGTTQKSFLEHFIRSILEEFNVTFEQNNRKILNGKELDFYLNDYNIGIEANGIYWHSDKFKSPLYHIKKTDAATESGILLLHIFEDEIKKKPELVRSRILSILNIYESRIFARKCDIVKLNSKEANNFISMNHLQGESGASKRYGLMHNGEIVSVMTFGHLRKNMGKNKEADSWELIRFCNKKGVSVIGGASKLLKFFIRNNDPKKIISYCDRRWSNGDFYENIGFKNTGSTKPNYWYVKNGEREYRFKYRKDQLIKSGFDKEKSESTIMNERGFARIYDCGSYRFIINI